MLSGDCESPIIYGSIMVNLIFQFIFIGAFCGGIAGALVGDPYLCGAGLMAALGCMMLIMFREHE